MQGKKLRVVKPDGRVFIGPATHLDRVLVDVNKCFTEAQTAQAMADGLAAREGKLIERNGWKVQLVDAEATR